MVLWATPAYASPADLPGKCINGFARLATQLNPRVMRGQVTKNLQAEDFALFEKIRQGKNLTEAEWDYLRSKNLDIHMRRYQNSGKALRAINDFFADYNASAPQKIRPLGWGKWRHRAMQLLTLGTLPDATRQRALKVFLKFAENPRHTLNESDKNFLAKNGLLPELRLYRQKLAENPPKFARLTRIRQVGGRTRYGIIASATAAGATLALTKRHEMTPDQDKTALDRLNQANRRTVSIVYPQGRFSQPIIELADGTSFTFNLGVMNIAGNVLSDKIKAGEIDSYDRVTLNLSRSQYRKLLRRLNTYNTTSFGTHSMVRVYIDLPAAEMARIISQSTEINLPPLANRSGELVVDYLRLRRSITGTQMPGINAIHSVSVNRKAASHNQRARIATRALESFFLSGIATSMPLISGATAVFIESLDDTKVEALVPVE